MPGEEIYELYIDRSRPRRYRWRVSADYMASFCRNYSGIASTSTSGGEAGKFEGRCPRGRNRSAQSRQTGRRGPLWWRTATRSKALTEIDDKLAEDNAVGRIGPRLGETD